LFYTGFNVDLFNFTKENMFVDLILRNFKASPWNLLGIFVVLYGI